MGQTYRRWLISKPARFLPILTLAFLWGLFAFLFSLGLLSFFGNSYFFVPFESTPCEVVSFDTETADQVCGIEGLGMLNWLNVQVRLGNHLDSDGHLESIKACRSCAQSGEDPFSHCCTSDMKVGERLVCSIYDGAAHPMYFLACDLHQSRQHDVFGAAVCSGFCLTVFVCHVVYVLSSSSAIESPPRCITDRLQSVSSPAVVTPEAPSLWGAISQLCADLAQYVCVVDDTLVSQPDLAKLPPLRSVQAQSILSLEDIRILNGVPSRFLSVVIDHLRTHPTAMLEESGDDAHEGLVVTVKSFDGDDGDDGDVPVAASVSSSSSSSSRVVVTPQRTEVLLKASVPSVVDYFWRFHRGQTVVDIVSACVLLMLDLTFMSAAVWEGFCAALWWTLAWAPWVLYRLFIGPLQECHILTSQRSLVVTLSVLGYATIEYMPLDTPEREDDDAPVLGTATAPAVSTAAPVHASFLFPERQLSSVRLSPGLTNTPSSDPLFSFT
eukprot:gnl/Spiro4/1116_TR589_c0_g1_i1.p1 gnl/Spiro4/1116_TR589_c0_g1~~gnl/Spiro4/1116_TR589_c0_g1_i1.p1  ORF type:complete len:496 (+),score=64.37 gnl/Spiro4/1116_TR589_c0_g1_i1:157-1644(+)